MLDWIIGKLTSAAAGGVLKVFGTAILGPILDRLNARTSADLDRFKTAVGAERDVAIAQMQAHVTAGAQMVEMRRLQWGWWGTRWLMLAAAAPAVWHSGLVYLDSCPILFPLFGDGILSLEPIRHVVGSWRVATAPGPYQGQELQIIAAVVGYQLGQTAVGGFVRWLNK